MRRGVHASAAITVWLALGAVRTAEAPRFVPTWRDVQATARAGRDAWTVLRIWGIQSRWCEPARGDRQRNADACGPAALCTVLRSRGCQVTQELFWSTCRLPQGGTTLGRLASVARRLGYGCDVRWCSAFETLRLPAIVHLRCGHFVVLEAAGARAARIVDPACGRLWVPWEALRQRSSGAVLVLADRRNAVAFSNQSPYAGEV